jgi:hypothetical protein
VSDMQESHIEQERFLDITKEDQWSLAYIVFSIICFVLCCGLFLTRRFFFKIWISAFLLQRFHFPNLYNFMFFCQSNTVSIKTVFWLNDFEVRVRKSFSEVLWLLVFIFVISLGISVIYENWSKHLKALVLFIFEFLVWICS